MPHIDTCLHFFITDKVNSFFVRFKKPSSNLGMQRNTDLARHIDGQKARICREMFGTKKHEPNSYYRRKKGQIKAYVAQL